MVFIVNRVRHLGFQQFKLKYLIEIGIMSAKLHVLKCEFWKTWVSKTGCHGNVKVNDHVIQVPKHFQKIFRKIRQVFGGDSFNCHEVMHL